MTKRKTDEDLARRAAETVRARSKNKASEARERLDFRPASTEIESEAPTESEAHVQQDERPEPVLAPAEKNKDKGGMKRFTLDLDPADRRALKQVALDADVTTSKLMRALLHEMLADAELKSRVLARLHER